MAKSEMGGSGRLVLIGIDGASYGMIDQLAADGTLPHMQRLIQAGAFRRMISSLPEVSPVAWSSIITGADPAEHGTFGFTDLAPHSYRTIFPNARTLAVPPFWNREGYGRTVVINMPFTYPARPMNGVLIAGFVALDLEKATFPPSLVPELQRMDYRTDVDSNKAHQSLELFLTDLDRTLQARIAVYRHLWESEPWKTFVLVFTGTDRLSHFLWDAYLDPTHRYHEAFLDHFRQVDAVVGEIADQLRAKDVLVIVSDHGFEPLNQNVYVNAILRAAGLLRFKGNSPQRMRDISPAARAFALEPSRVYVHAKDKYPTGAVAESDQEAVLRDVIDLFRDITFEGQPAIKCVFRKEEIYHGPLLDRAPDLVLLAEPGFNLRGSLKATECFGQDLFTGKHARDNAVFLACGNYDQDVIPEQPHVADVVGIIDRITRGGLK
jgi:predicted AlkP superfamily phosphohydrolase/phosphomutase